MNNEEILKIVKEYGEKEFPRAPDKNSYAFASDFKHNFDIDSSVILYSLIRHFKPTNVLEFGTSYGGSACVMIDALLKNRQPFYYMGAEMEDGLLGETVNNVRKECGIVPFLVKKIEDYLDFIPHNLDFVFIDTNHDMENTKWYVENIFPRIKKKGLVAIHDWAVWEENGVWLGKGDGGAGGFPETEYLIRLHKEKKLPLEKIYWSYKNPLWDGMSSSWESSFWFKI